MQRTNLNGKNGKLFDITSFSKNALIKMDGAILSTAKEVGGLLNEYMLRPFIEFYRDTVKPTINRGVIGDNEKPKGHKDPQEGRGGYDEI